MEQARHFLEECEVLHSLIATLDERDFEKKSQFKNWSINDILVHLHFWNQAADLSLNNPDAFAEMFNDLHGALQNGTLRAHENSRIEKRGAELVSDWRDYFRDMASRWQSVDPKTRVKWAGPDMSVRTSISARQMETWAHGQAIFDMFGKDRPESDRLFNIVMLGINAFGWSHKVQGLNMPEKMPSVGLVSPSGETWEFGEGEDAIEGYAAEFCQVVTQTRNIADTALLVRGESARTWMQNAQCFAGTAESPPKPGTRFKV